MDVVETASSNASSEDLAMYDESPKGAKLDGLWSPHDAVICVLLASPLGDPLGSKTLSY